MRRDSAPNSVKSPSPPRMEASPPSKPTGRAAVPPSQTVTSPPPVQNVTPISPPMTEAIPSPPANVTKSASTGQRSVENSGAPRVPRRETPISRETSREVPAKIEKLSLVATESTGETESVVEPSTNEVENKDAGAGKSEESNGVGDKIKKFEKAASDAGRPSRPGSVRGRPRAERLGSDNSAEDLPPPATPFKDNVHFELEPAPPAERPAAVLERHHSLTRNAAASIAGRWQRTDGDSADGPRPRPEPQKIIKPEFKPMPSPVDVTIRSPSLGAKIADQFPSHGTAFRNVASPDPARTRDVHKLNDDVNTQNNFKSCKFKNKEKYSVSKGSSYFTRGSEEIWLVKKKDIEEIEERVLDSFRRAGGNVCMRSESMRPASEGGGGGGGGQGAALAHATMGRRARPMYARSESLDPQWAGARAHTLKRQSSVACTCGHDKKTRAKTAPADAAPRPRSRSHGDDNQGHVLDKYETLV